MGASTARCFGGRMIAEHFSAREWWALETMERQQAVVESLERAAREATDQLDVCVRWLAVARLAPRYLRYLAPWVPGAGMDRALPHVEGFRRRLESTGHHAIATISTCDEGAKREARRRTGLRIAVIGKGGVGKTVIASTLARVLARRGRAVLAADLDTNPGMATSLGMDLGSTDWGLPLAALEEHEAANYGWQLASGLTPVDVVERFALSGPDGVRFLGIGKIGTVDKMAAKRSVAALIQVLVGFAVLGWDVIGDLEAGPTTPFERYHAFADDVLLVVGPNWQSALTARRLLPMVPGCRVKIIASGFNGESHHDGLNPWATIPFDPCVAMAERDGAAPLDACPGSPATSAIEALAERLLASLAIEA